MDFGSDLFLGAEEVGVVLGEAADAGHAVEFAGLFPAVDGAELGEAHGEVAVGVRLRGEDLDVVRAVHRLEQEAVEELVSGRMRSWPIVSLPTRVLSWSASCADTASSRAVNSAQPQPSEAILASASAFDKGGKLRFLVVRKVPRGFVECEFADVRRENLRVALLLQLGENEGLQFLA